MSNSAPKSMPTERERLARLDDLFMWILATCKDTAECERMLATKRRAVQMIRDNAFEEEIQEVLTACGIDPIDE